MLRLPEQERVLHEVNRNDVSCLRPYLLLLKLRELGTLHCEDCLESDCLFEFHHKRYGMNVTYADLVLLCRECHRGKDV